VEFSNWRARENKKASRKPKSSKQAWGLA